MGVTLVIDGRFPGGTSSAVASEIDALAPVLPDLKVVHLASNMFKGDALNPKLVAACERNGVPIGRNMRIADDVVVLHNLASLKFGLKDGYRFFANTLYVVTHENFSLPDGQEAFDVRTSLETLWSRSFAGTTRFAPVSEYNRSTILDWMASPAGARHRSKIALDPNCWFNICTFDRIDPTPIPNDRRGRLSRPGPEKFPSRADMLHCFSPKAASCLLLGMHHWTGETPRNWKIVPFNRITLDQFFENVDFFIYYTSPNWMESFGRVIAEAIMAGKLVIGDARLEQTFGSAIVSAKPQDVDQVVAHFIANPREYGERVLAAQAVIGSFSAQAFVERWGPVLKRGGEPCQIMKLGA